MAHHGIPIHGAIIDQECWSHMQLQRGRLENKNRSGDAWEHFTKFIRASALLLNLKMSRCLSKHFALKPFREADMIFKKHDLSSPWFYDLKIRIFTFRNSFVDMADQLTKSDINRKSKMAATILAWLQGIPPTASASRCQQNSEYADVCMNHWSFHKWIWYMLNKWFTLVWNNEIHKSYLEIA